MKTSSLLVLLLLWICALAVTPLTAQEAGDFSKDPRFQKQSILLGYPPVERTNRKTEWNRWTYRMCQVDCSEITTAEKAAQLAEHLKQRGYTIVLVGSQTNMYLFRDPGDDPYPVNNPPFPELIRNAALLTEALHKRGLKVMLHTTCSMVTQQFVERYPTLASIDQATGKPIFTSSKTYAMCVANPEFQNMFLERLEKLLKETGADTAMVDETSWWEITGCVCAYCRKAFKQETGLELPAPGSGTAFFNGNYPSYEAFSQWRRKAKLEFDQRVSSLIWKYGGTDCLRSTYNSNPFWSVLTFLGMQHSDWLLCADNVGYECEPLGHLYLYQWQHVIAEMKLFQSMARHTDSPPWTLFYTQLLGDPTFCWFLAMSQGSRVWWRDMPTETALVNWEINHEDLWTQTRPLANVGVLFSEWTGSLNSRYLTTFSMMDWWHGLEGLCDALTEKSFPYRLVVEQDLLQRDGPGVDVLFAMNVANLSMESAAGLIQFVKNGGVLISSGDISLYDTACNKRPDFLLSSVLGVSLKQRIENRQNNLVIDQPNELTGKLTGTWKHNRPFNEVVLRPGARAVGAMQTDQGKSYPGIVVNSFGKGCSVYFSGMPELGNMFTSYDRNLIQPGQPWQDERDVNYQNLLTTCARFRNDNLPFEVENVAPGILVEAHRQDSRDLKGIQIHLANLLGGNIKTGTIPSQYDITFPSVKAALPDPKKPIKLKVRANKVTGVYLLSPDFDAVVKMPFKMVDGSVEVELSDFARYAILYFNQGNEKPILRMGDGKAVSRIPKPKELEYKVSPPFAGAYDKEAVYLFSDLKQMTGGKGNIPSYRGMPAPEIAYGTRTAYHTIRANFRYSSSDAATLEMGGCDDNAPSKAPMEILINDHRVFQGACPFPDDAWDKHQWRIEKGILRSGDNTITIRNTGDSNLDSMPPWFMIHFIKIRP